MAALNVLIDYKPHLYADLFGQLLQKLGEVNLVRYHPVDPALDWSSIDVAVLSVDKEGQPDFEALREMSLDAMLVAFSPSGNLGLLRLPGGGGWNVIRPFGIDELVRTIFGETGSGNGTKNKN